MRWVAAGLFVLVIGLAGAAHGQWLENGKTVPDTSWRKAWGEHGAMLHLTDKPNELFAAWARPGAGVPISSVDSAKRGEPIVGVIFFTGCAADKAGLCNADAKLQGFKPDGSPYGTEEQGEVWVGRPPPAKGQIQLSVGAIGFVIEPQDPNGVYTVRVRLRDRVSGAEVELTRTFEVRSEDPG